MIRSETVPSRTVGGISTTSVFRSAIDVLSNEPVVSSPRNPMTAVPVGWSNASPTSRALCGPKTALNTAASQCGGSDKPSPNRTSTLSSPRLRTALLARSVRRPARSSSVTWVSGQRMASGMPGRPTPAPTSSSRGGGPAAIQPRAKASESQRWRVQIRSDSLGPSPPATMASSSNHTAK